MTGIEIADKGRRRHIEKVTESFDPFGQAYYWIGSPRKEGAGRGRSDIEVCARGAVAVTPLDLDLTDHRQAKKLQGLFQ